MKAISFLKIATVAAFMLVGLSVSAPVQAAGVGNWNSTSNGPTIFQSQWQFDSSWMVPPGRVPSTAKVSTVSWVLHFINYVPANQFAYLNAGSTYWGPIGLSGNGGIGVGISAKQNFRFSFWNNTFPAKILTPTVYTGGHQLNVNYQY